MPLLRFHTHPVGAHRRVSLVWHLPMHLTPGNYSIGLYSFVYFVQQNQTQFPLNNQSFNLKQPKCCWWALVAMQNWMQIPIAYPRNFTNTQTNTHVDVVVAFDVGRTFHFNFPAENAVLLVQPTNFFKQKAIIRKFAFCVAVPVVSFRIYFIAKHTFNNSIHSAALIKMPLILFHVNKQTRKKTIGYRCRYNCHISVSLVLMKFTTIAFCWFISTISTQLTTQRELELHAFWQIHHSHLDGPSHCPLYLLIIGVVAIYGG